MCDGCAFFARQTRRPAGLLKKIRLGAIDWAIYSRRLPSRVQRQHRHRLRDPRQPEAERLFSVVISPAPFPCPVLFCDRLCPMRDVVRPQRLYFLQLFLGYPATYTTTRAQISTVFFYGRAKFCCKTAQFYETPCQRLTSRHPACAAVCNIVKTCANAHS